MPTQVSTRGYPTGRLDRLLWPLRTSRGDFPAPLMVTGDLALWIFWFWGMLQCRVLPEPEAIVWVCVFGAAFVWRYSLSPRRIGSRRRIDPRLGFGSASGPEVLAGAAAFSVFGHLWYVSYRHLPGITPPPAGPWDASAGTVTGLVLAIAVAVVVGPLMEEFCFRGWLLPALTASYGVAVGVGVSALAFAAAHAHPAWIPYHFVSGVVFAVAVRLTGSVWVAVVMHASRNVIAQLQLDRVPMFEELGGSLTGNQGELILALVGMAAACGALVLLARRQVVRAGAGA